jgi:hypothetical protein
MTVLNAPLQNFMVPCKQGGHFIRISLRQLRAAFNIREKEGNGAGREVIHYFFPMQIQLPVLLS